MVWVVSHYLFGGDSDAGGKHGVYRYGVGVPGVISSQVCDLCVRLAECSEDFEHVEIVGFVDPRPLKRRDVVVY